jgi:uncharacterized cupredoxin-like copper-binding protein
MAKPNKPEHIQIKKAETTVSVGKNSNKLHFELTLSIDQEERLLKMLKKRKDRRPKK